MKTTNEALTRLKVETSKLKSHYESITNIKMLISCGFVAVVNGVATIEHDSTTQMLSITSKTFPTQFSEKDIDRIKSVYPDKNIEAVWHVDYYKRQIEINEACIKMLKAGE